MEKHVTTSPRDEHTAAKTDQVVQGSARAAVLKLVSRKSNLRPDIDAPSDDTPIEVDKVAASTEWSVIRPQITSESRNCKVCKTSTETQLSLEPIFDLQYLTLLIAGVIAACLLSLGLSNVLPLMKSSNVLAAIDPTVKAFIFLFGIIAFAFTATLLRKPVRALIFDKATGVFWIEKRRLFGWKVGESAQMPISQVYALQMISYADNKLHHSVQNKMAEVNVVFRNGTRVNLINHNNKSALHSDATALCSFLNIPLWDKEPASTS